MEEGKAKSAAGSEKAKALAAALSQIEKQFGKGSIMRLGSKGPIVPISVPARPPWHCMPSPRHRSWAGPALSSMPSTPSIRSMRKSSA